MPKTLAQRQLAKARKAQGSPLENRFLTLWKQLGGPELEREWRFDLDRKFRLDFSYKGYEWVAIEICGGIYNKKSGHNSISGIERDYEKSNLAQLNGWKYFQLSPSMITSEHLCPIINLCK